MRVLQAQTWGWISPLQGESLGLRVGAGGEAGMEHGDIGAGTGGHQSGKKSLLSPDLRSPSSPCISKPLRLKKTCSLPPSPTEIEGRVKLGIPLCLIAGETGSRW